MAAASLLVLLAAIGGCKDRDRPAKQPPPAAEDEQGDTNDEGLRAIYRLVACRAERGDGVSAKLMLGNSADQTVSQLDVWIYAYDGSRVVGRQQMGVSETIAPSEDKAVVVQLADELAGDLECDVVAATLEDGTVWRNDNLVFAAGQERQRGGPEASASDEVPSVAVTWSGKIEGRAQFALENRGARPLTVTRIAVFYRDPAGKILKRVVGFSELALAPGQKQPQVPLGLRKERIPEGTETVIAVVSGVRFTDPKGGEWSDRNLEQVR